MGFTGISVSAGQVWLLIQTPAGQPASWSFLISNKAAHIHQLVVPSHHKEPDCGAMTLSCCAF